MYHFFPLAILSKGSRNNNSLFWGDGPSRLAAL